MRVKHAPTPWGRTIIYAFLTKLLFQFISLYARVKSDNERHSMILDYALEKFPLHAKLRDGTECVVRPLGKRDAARLHKFILTVPEEERLFIKQPVAERGLFHE